VKRLLRLFAAPRHPAAGGALLHPIFAVSLVSLVVNDHLIKRYWPGVLSGKLSDFAVVVLLPLFLHGLIELAHARVGRALGVVASARWLLGCVVLSSLVFALPEVSPTAELAYRHGAAWLRYPFQLLWSLAHGRPAPRFVPVRATADLTDLLALPMALLAWRVGRVDGTGAPQASAVSHST
jgi:hypothetical protein